MLSCATPIVECLHRHTPRCTHSCDRVVWGTQASGDVVRVLKADEDVVNCIQVLWPANPSSLHTVCSESRVQTDRLTTSRNEVV